MLCESQSKDGLQHHDANPGGKSNKHLVEEAGGSNLITKNRSSVSLVYCTHGSGEEPAAQDGMDLSNSQQDSERKKNRGKNIGKEVLLMQALSTLSTPEEKLAVLCKKCTDLLEEIWNNQKQMRILKRTQAQILKEKIHLQREQSKAILARSKLESLCRELQHHNRMLKEENMQQAREEEESHQKATSYFQFTLNEIQVQLEQCEIHNTKLQQENTELGGKLRMLTEECTLSKEDFDEMFKHKGLQQQLVDAKLQQTAQLIKEADDRHQREREFEAAKSRHRYEEMKQQEVHLKQQISLYMNMFEDFQTIVTRRSKLFTTILQEVEKVGSLYIQLQGQPYRIKKMTKKIENVEKEMILWRTKWEGNNKVLLKMAEKNIIHDKVYRIFQMKLERLEKLFRALQMERNELHEKLLVLKEQVSVKAADVNSATPVMQPHTALDSQKELNTYFL